MKQITVSELFKKYDFDSVLPHLDHLFVVNSGHNLSPSQIENARRSQGQAIDLFGNQ